MSRYLLDTHVLLWAAVGSERLPPFTRTVLEEAGAAVSFSVVNLWEIVIKSGAGRPDFRVDAGAVRVYARAAGLHELTVTGEHILGVSHLEPLHRDPFDRLLVAQARHEQLQLLTLDRSVLAYEDGVRPA